MPNVCLPGAGGSPAGVDTPDAVEAGVARLLTIGTFLSVGLLAAGVVALVVAGVSPLAGGPPLDVTLLPGDLLAAKPAGFLWLGLVAAIATPCARVIASLFGYVRRGERPMALVALLILAVIALSVVAASAID